MMNEHEKRIFNFLKALGFTEEASCGIMANLYCESGHRGDNVQNSYERKVGNDRAYTDRVNSGKISRKSFGSDSAGYGLAQWTSKGRKLALYDFCMSHNKDISLIEDQLFFLAMVCHQLKLFPKLNKCKTAYDAAILLLTNFERPMDQSLRARMRRGSLGTSYWIKLKGV